MSYVQEDPIAFVRLIPPMYRLGCFDWEVISCPFCGQSHRHGAGDDLERVMTKLGYRLSHCVGGNRNYKLVPAPPQSEVAPSKPLTTHMKYYKRAHRGDMTLWPLMERCLIEQGLKYQRSILRGWKDRLDQYRGK
ncbi:MAG: hypothetical protein WCO51_12025 [bacterium]